MSYFFFLMDHYIMGFPLFQELLMDSRSWRTRSSTTPDAKDKDVEDDDDDGVDEAAEGEG